MKNQFVKTENVNQLLIALSKLANRGAAEACLLVLDGLPGLGKSAATSWLAGQRESLYVRMNAGCTPASVMGDMVEALGGRAHKHYKPNFLFVKDKLQERSMDAGKSGEEFIVFIDEADHITGSKVILETLRDLSDFLEIPFILIGMDKLRNSLRRFPQITSRVGQMVQFKPLSHSDVEKVFKNKCECEVDAELLKQVTASSRGYMREIMDALKNIENFANRQSVDGAVTASLMAGQPLFFDRASNKPVVVRG